MTSLEVLKKQFLEYLEIEKGRSVKTVENYDRYLRRFFDFSKIGSADGINEDMVRKYRLYLNRANLDKSTQNYYIIALRWMPKRSNSRSLRKDSSTFWIFPILKDYLRLPRAPTKKRSATKRYLRCFSRPVFVFRSFVG